MNEQKKQTRTSEVYLDLEIINNEYERNERALNLLICQMQDKLYELKESKFISDEFKMFELEQLETINEMQLDYINNLNHNNVELEKVMSKYKNQEQA